jgi:hypothetical protein
MSIDAPAAAEELLDRHARLLVEALRRSAERRANETELREDVHALIARAVEELYGLDAFTTTAERRAGRSARLYDRAYGGLVVEWEWRMGAARRRKGAREALEYLRLMRADLGTEDAFSAVVCDGRQFGFLIDDVAQEQLELDQALLPERADDERFEWRPVSRASCRRFLQLIGTNRKRPVNARALASEFGPGSPQTRKAITLLVEALGGRSRRDRTDTLFGEWHRSLEVVYEDLEDPDGRLAAVLRDAYGLTARRPLGELLFCVHTYFALVARLIAIEVLALSSGEHDAEPSSWASDADEQLERRLRAIDAGEVPATLNVDNLFEGDVFSWYLDALRGNSDLLDAVRDVLNSIGLFALPRLAFGANPATDVLRDLYQQLLPRELRGALGEFLTPQWLAEACLERLAQRGAPLSNGRVLDPTCGTGTFLLPVLGRRAVALRAASKELASADVQAVLDTVVGFDLNPVAVIAARVNFVIALGDLVNVGGLTLPVWRADSILVPDVHKTQSQMTGGRLDGREWISLATSLEEPFPIPPRLANAASMPVLARLLEQAVETRDERQGLEDFAAGLERELGPDGPRPAAAGREWEDVREVALELCERIRQLNKDERNGVWARIIENSSAPLFVGRFDVVVGNPPWLGWGKMPASWRAAGMTHWKRFGLWRPPRERGQRPAKPQMGDVATLVYATAVARYADERAYVGLLIPNSMLIGDPGGRAFRRFRLAAAADDVREVGYGPRRSFRALHADLWSEVNPFAPDASNKPVFLISRVDEDNSFPVPTSRWTRAARARLGPTWSKARAALLEGRGESWPVERAVATSQWSFVPTGTSMLEGGSNQWTFGKGLDTRGANGVYCVEALSGRPNAGGKVEIANLPQRGRDKSIRRRHGRVEAALVYPLLRGREVKRWTAEPAGYVFAPYRQEAMGVGLTDKEFNRDFPDGYRWLSAFKPALAARKVVASRNWNMQGDDWGQIMGTEHMTGKPCVVVREQAKRPAAAVLTKRYDARLGRSATVLIDHKLLFCRVRSIEEAHYLAAMINARPMQNLLASFLNEIGVAPGTLARLPIPPYEETLATDLIQAAKDAAAAAAANEKQRLTEAESRIDEEVTSLLES